MKFSVKILPSVLIVVAIILVSTVALQDNNNYERKLDSDDENCHENDNNEDNGEDTENNENSQEEELGYEEEEDILIPIDKQIACADYRYNIATCEEYFYLSYVCATFSEPQEGSSTKTFDNKCFACAELNVSSYIHGRCKDAIFRCDSRPSECIQDEFNLLYDPVCGLTSQGEERTFETPCDACLDSSILTYVEGVCKNQTGPIYYCDPSITNNTSDESTNVVCAFYRARCPEELCSVSVKNPYYACAMENIIYWTSDQCEKESDGRILCNDEDRFDTCQVDEEASQVCVSGNDDSFGTNFTNKCAACKDPSIFNYYNKSCRDPCEDIDPCDDYFSPVCGITTNKETRTYANLCTACKDTSLVKYSKGVCQDNPTIRCVDELFPRFDFQPVCGFFEDGCDNTSCRKSFQDSGRACEDSQVISYQDGLCPNDQGILCDTIDCPDIHWEPDWYSPEFICGSSLGSNNVTFESPCLACADNSITFYNIGPCKDERQFCRNNTFNNCGEYAPVCAFSPNCGKDVCSETQPNACTACKDSPETNFKPGRCEDIKIYCDHYEQCDDNVIDYVCFFSNVNCAAEQCNVTAVNSCIACESETHLYWTPGKCKIESIERVFVDRDNRPETCPSEKNYVCGYAWENPIVGVTYLNECFARQDPSVYSYSLWECLL